MSVHWWFQNRSPIRFYVQFMFYSNEGERKKMLQKKKKEKFTKVHYKKKKLSTFSPIEDVVLS